MTDSTFIKRVRLKNYRSIESCDVTLGPLNFLVGPNGSGKSNFLDVLRFVTDSLRQPVSESLAVRGGPWGMQWHSDDLTPPPDIEICLELVLPEDSEGIYELHIGPEGVQNERLRIREPHNQIETTYNVQNGTEVMSNVVPAPAALADRLYLVNASGLPQFRPVYEALTHVGVYNIDPNLLRKSQPVVPSPMLDREGKNLNGIMILMGVYERVNFDDGSKTGRLILDYLATILPGLKDVVANFSQSDSTLTFNQPSNKQSVRLFGATSMSDGTLRALGNLVALFQIDGRTGRRPSVVGIEEPEAALHPAASGVLLDALREASQTTQVIVTSHSPDLLDRDDIPQEQILAVESQNGATKINRIDEASRSALEERLTTPGELLRLNQLAPEAAEAKSA